MNKFIALMFTIVIGLIVTTAGALAEKQQVKGYTKKNGTVVKGYTRTKKTAAPAADTQQVKGYTTKDGTVVAGYTRKKAAAKSTSK